MQQALRKILNTTKNQWGIKENETDSRIQHTLLHQLPHDANQRGRELQGEH